MIDEMQLRKLDRWASAWKVLPPHSSSDVPKLRNHLEKLQEFMPDDPLAQAQASILRVLLVYPEDMTDLEVRFWGKVHIVDDDDSCWHFGGYLYPDFTAQYGSFNLGGRGQSMLAHRMAFALTNGMESPPCVRHTCDNPPCVRPSHLLPGTHAENMRDKFERGRGRTRYNQRGEANDSAILTDTIVLEARRRYRNGESAGQLAKAMEVPLSALQGALSGVTWTHLNEIEPPTKGRLGGSFLNETDVRLIRKIYAEAPTDRAGRRAVMNELAERYMVSSANIYAIVKRKSWKHVEDDPAPDARPVVLAPNATLTEADVIQVRRRVKQDESCEALAVEFNVSSMTIRRAAYGHNWTHLNDIESPADSGGKEVTNAAFTEDQVRDIRRRHADGESVPKIHKDYPGRGLQTLYAITQRRTWKHVTD
jgi:hypothetical protein